MAKAQVKSKKLLDRRIKHYENMCRNSNYGGKEYTKQGSQKR